MTKYRGIIPGVFTMGNLFCGFASVITSLKGEKPTEAAWLIIFAAFFDFLDGLVARLYRGVHRGLAWSWIRYLILCHLGWPRPCCCILSR